MFTPLHFAARHGHSVTVERICILHKLLAWEDHLSWINAFDQYGACTFSFPLALDLPVLIPPNSFRSTPLDLAARWGHLETVRVLLRQGATVFKDELLDYLSRIGQQVVAQPSDDVLRIRENWRPISFALRRALFIQRNDADQPLTPRLTAMLRSHDFCLEDWRAVNAHLGVTSIADIQMLPIEEVERSLSQAAVPMHQHLRAVRLWLHHMPTSGE
jgi:ankyrin repeat protein